MVILLPGVSNCGAWSLKSKIEMFNSASALF